MQQSLNDAEWRKRLVSALPNLTKSQKRVAEYLAAHPVDLAFMTTLELARVTNVSEASIIRFSRALGYDGYQALQQEIRELVTQAFAPFQLLELTTQNAADRDNNILSRITEADVQSIRASAEQISRPDFDRAAELLGSASLVLVIGTRGLHSLAHYVSHFLNQVRPGVQLIDSTNDRLPEQLVDAGSSTVVLVFHFARYSLRISQAIQILHARGAQIVLVVDSLVAPGAELATVVLRVQPYISGFFRSQTATLSLLNALIVAVAFQDSAQSRTRLELLEQTLRSFQTHVQSNVPRSKGLPLLLPLDHEDGDSE